jgi:hypothetical protein
MREGIWPASFTSHRQVCSSQKLSHLPETEDAVASDEG